MDTDKPLSWRKCIRKSTTTGTVALTGATPLPRHQPQKIFHLNWYNREEDSRRTPAMNLAALPEKPNFRVDALMEQTAMGLPKQFVPARQSQGWLGQKKQ